MDLLKLFCDYHPNFMEQLDDFSLVNKEKLLEKLKKAKNRTAFLSTISEINFGKFFKKLNFEIKYDEKFDKQTPDWTLNLSTFPIICEVYRLGKSMEDQKKADFKNSLKEELQKIPSEYIIKINIGSEYDHTVINQIKERVEKWLKELPNLNDELVVDYEISFKIIDLIKKNKFLSCISSGKIDYKISKVKQVESHRPNEITKKIKKYNDIIFSKKIPFFICVDIDFLSGFNHDEFEEYFLGSSVGFEDFDPNIAITTEIGILGKEWTKLGMFYENIQISGIITRSNNTFKVLLNPIQKQIIYDDQYSDYLKRLREYNYVR